MMSRIPDIDMPRIAHIDIDEHDEPLVSLSDAGFMCESMYYSQGIEHALVDCYARQGLVAKLKEAEKLLPDGIGFKIYDAYRPIFVQQYLWDMYEKQIRAQYPDMNDDDVKSMVLLFVSEPSYDIYKPSLHNTGGAVDLTLFDKSSGCEFDMGTAFDDFSSRANTSYFEKSVLDDDISVIRDNRRLLYNALISVGFTNLPSEWWHYDYGDAVWSYFKGQSALYIGKLTFGE